MTALDEQAREYTARLSARSVAAVGEPLITPAMIRAGQAVHDHILDGAAVADIYRAMHAARED